MAPKLTQTLRNEYQSLFDTCVILPARAADVEQICDRIERYRNRYAGVSDPLRIPWFVVAVIHSLEADLNFNCHLHNGDPLSARTVNVPAGRPPSGSPPFTWEESATDALQFDGLDQVSDWSIPSILYHLEGYNGWGYRAKGINTPYLWSYSNHYSKGKFVGDRKYSPTAVSQQCGGAVILRRLSERGAIQFNDAGFPLPSSTSSVHPDIEPLVRFSLTERSPEAELLQEHLNTFPGIFVKVDGLPGYRTSDAVRRLTGHYLLGDPRA